MSRRYDIDYYEVLGISRSATPSEVKRAFKNLALQHHPDKVSQESREEAEIRFKNISQAYEVLNDETERQYYDRVFFGGGSGGLYGGAEDDYGDFEANDFAQFFGNFGSNAPKPPKTSRTKDEHILLKLSLEDLYKGKVMKMASARNVLCKSCSGSGAKSKARPGTCSACSGEGMVKKLRRLSPGVVTSDWVDCSVCSGRGTIVKVKDRCKKCSGSGLSEEKTILEVYIPKGVRSGYRVVLHEKSDEAYGKRTGDLVFDIEQADHKLFERRGNDVIAKFRLTLYESLCGFSKVVIQHLDGRGIKVTVPDGNVTPPHHVFKVKNAGFPVKGTDMFGDLYLVPDIEFPRDGWMRQPGQVNLAKELFSMLRPDRVNAEIEDEVDYTIEGSIPDLVEEEEDYHGMGQDGVPECTTM
jgi:DnaJ family protein A protein 2